MNQSTKQPTEIFAASIATILDAVGEEHDREREIIVRRFGLKERRETLEQIGELLGITRERVRQLEKAIVVRLKLAAEAGELEGLHDAERLITRHGAQAMQYGNGQGWEVLRERITEVMTYDDFSTQGQMFTNIIVNTFEFLDKKVPEHARNAESNYGYNADQGYGYDPAYYDPNANVGADTGFDVNDQYALTGQNPRN